MLLRGLEHFQNNWSLKGSVIRKTTIEKYKTKKKEVLEVLKLIVINE